MKSLRISLIIRIRSSGVDCVCLSIRTNPEGICAAIPHSSFLIPNSLAASLENNEVRI